MATPLSSAWLSDLNLNRAGTRRNLTGAPNVHYLVWQMR
jgi:hypothetical protein